MGPVDPDLRRAIRIGVVLGLWLAGAYLALDTLVAYHQYGGVAKDAHAYWLTAHGGKLYGIAPGTKDAYLYSPAFAQVVRPLALLPFAWFAAICMVLDALAFAWLLAPLGLRWAAPIMLFTVPELMPAQVTGIITAGVVLAVTGRGGWSAVGWLTKITPGAFSVAWLLSRRDWRGVAAALGWTAAISLVSFALWPSAWSAWFHFLISTPTSPWTPVREGAALVLVLVGGRRGWWWVVPVALAVAAPVLGGLYVLTALTGLARLAPRQTPAAVTTASVRNPASSPSRTPA
jgi:Glycosyltransferase family 87